MRRWIVLSFLLSGCRSVDFEAQVLLREGTIDADLAAPDELARLDASVVMTAGRYFDGEIVVDQLQLGESYQCEVELASDVYLSHGGTRVERLVNLSATNGELAPLCGQTLEAIAWRPYGENGHRGNVGGGPIEVRCAP